MRHATCLALTLLMASCSRVPPLEMPDGDAWRDGETWTETPLDDALAEAVDGCHIRVETVGDDNRRVRERWEAPEWSLVIFRSEADPMQVRARVTRGEAQLEVFASLPPSDIPRATLLRSLARPQAVPRAPWSTLMRVSRDKRRGEMTQLEEYGTRELRSRSVTRERDDGETVDARLLWPTGRSIRRAWVDDEGRHVELRTRRDGEEEHATRILEERDEDGRVVLEHREDGGFGRPSEYTTEYRYHDDGRLVAPDSRRRSPPADVTIARDPAGHPTQVTIPDYAELTGVWEGDRLKRVVTRFLGEHARFVRETLDRTFDDEGRLIHSVLARQPVEGPESQSVMTVSYAGCAADVELVREPTHESLLERSFDE